MGTTLIDRPQPPREEEVVTMVAPTAVEAVEPEPTLTRISKVAPAPLDVREAWYGNYDGFAIGRDVVWDSPWDYIPLVCEATTLPSALYACEFTDKRLWLEIIPYELCSYIDIDDPFCDEDTPWGLDIESVVAINSLEVSEVLLYMPENLSDAPNLTITEDTIHITPTEEHPYELVIEKVDGQLQGFLRLEGPFPERWTRDASAAPDIDYFEIEGTTGRHPYSGG